MKKLEEELEASDSSEESVEIKVENDDDNNNDEADPGETNTPSSQPEEGNDETKVKQEVKEEDGDDDNNVTPAQEPICSQCGAEFKSKSGLLVHRAQVHKKSPKICLSKISELVNTFLHSLQLYFIAM